MPHLEHILAGIKQSQEKINTPPKSGLHTGIFSVGGGVDRKCSAPSTLLLGVCGGMHPLNFFLDSRSCEIDSEAI